MSFVWNFADFQIILLAGCLVVDILCVPTLEPSRLNLLQAALHLAARNDHVDVATVLLQHGADVNLLTVRRLIFSLFQHLYFDILLLVVLCCLCGVVFAVTCVLCVCVLCVLFAVLVVARVCVCSMLLCLCCGCCCCYWLWNSYRLPSPRWRRPASPARCVSTRLLPPSALLRSVLVPPPARFPGIWLMMAATVCKCDVALCS